MPTRPPVRALSCLLSAALVWLSPAAQAAGERAALKHTVVSAFNDDDMALMRSRVVQALKSDDDGQTLAWRNEKTRSSGTVTPVQRLTSQGLACRRLRIANQHDEARAEGIYRFCMQPPGRWKLVGPDPSPP